MLSTIGMLVYVYVLMQAFEQMGRARSNSSVILAALTVWAATGTTYDFVVIPPQFGVAQQAVGTEISKPISPATWLLLALVVFAVSTVAAARGLRRIFEDAPHPPAPETTEKKAS